MQEKKNKRSLVLLIVLLSATFIAAWFRGGDVEKATDPDIFRGYDLKTVDQVILESPQQKVELKYNGRSWRVNDAFAADPSMVEVLFATLQQAAPKRPLATSQRDTLASILRADGVKVSIVSNGTLEKSFYAGGNSEKTQAYFMLAGEGLPYLMTIPGYRVYVSGIFELEESGWREKRVFAFNWRNFQQLEVSFPGDPSQDFRVALEDQFFTISGMDSPDTTKLNDFLDNVSLLSADEFAPASATLDSIGKQKPVVTISVRDVAAREFKLSVYPPRGKGNRYPGILNGKQWAYFSQENVSAVVRPRKFFEKKD